MAGLYLHIPFCKRRCIYCDFYSTTCIDRHTEYTKALCREIALRKDFLKTNTLSTIYIGGGTPSLLPIEDLSFIFEEIKRHFHISPSAEITLEMNPDDVSASKVEEIRQHTPINRVSMGVQSFNNEDLRLLQRRHTSDAAIKAVETLKNSGLTNINIDLIYGLPGQTLAGWEKNIQKALELDVPHLSAYALIYEENTKLWTLRDEGVVQEAPEQTSLDMFNSLIDHVEKAGFVHYEISNFAKPNFESKHNSSYWDEVPYLGCGPSAHSYNGECRQWNLADLDTYIKTINELHHGITPSQPLFESEHMSIPTRYNDRVVTSIRTAKGLDIYMLEQDFGADLATYCLRMAEPYLQQGLLEKTTPSDQKPKGVLKLTREGIFLSDGIMSDLMWVD